MYKKRIKLNHLLKKINIPYNYRMFLLRVGLKKRIRKNEVISLESLSPFPKGTSIINHNFKAKRYDLAIIVAAYNSQDYINSCISSLVNQKTQYNYSIIVVNDGSTDNTGIFLDKWHKKFPNLIKVIKSENEGLSSARNKAIEASTADYITFVDADDFVEKTFVEVLMKNAFEKDADIVEGGYQTINQGVIEKYPNTDILNANAFEDLYGYPWGKVYRQSLFKNVQFPIGFWFEDTVGMYRIWPNTNKVVTISDILYNYRINMKGITHSSYSNPKALDSFYITIRLLEDYKELGIAFTDEIYTFTLQQMVINFTRIISLSNRYLKTVFFIMVEVIDDFFPSSKFKCLDKRSLIIEQALRRNDYSLFVGVCLAQL